MSNTIFTASRDPSLPPKLHWKHANEPAQLEWTVRARNYNTVVANCIFYFMAALISGVTAIMYGVYEGMNQPWRTLSCAFFFIVMLFIISCMTHQQVNFACRISESGLEYCKWKDFPNWTLTSLKWLSIATAIIFIFLATIDPSFLFGALLGPGGMGLTYFFMINSKNYREMHSQYNYYAFKWSDFTQLAIATNREVVDLQYSVIQDGHDHKTEWNLNIFCKKNQKNLVANVMKIYLPSEVPFINAKVNVPLSTE
ncbi:hypothetical protein [Pseudomonas sp. TWP3-1]|uniref:hypothetical protein n=1 Tax=Pseudomonas sp. TWP3-1 TaxID=2804631 RepID=UPI003CF04BA6